MIKEEKKKIKLLLVVCNNVLNGTERYVVDLANNLPKEKFDIDVATPLNGALSSILCDHNIREIIFNNGKLYRYSLKGLYNLAKILRQNKYDVLHANAGIWPCLVGKIMRVKLIIELKHGIFYSHKQLESLSVFRKIYEIGKQLLVDKFLVTSQNDKNILIKYFRVKEDIISVIPLGLDINELKKKVSNLKHNDFDKSNIIIGHIGRLTYQKAQEILLQAFNLLVHKYPRINLIIIGDGENKQNLMKFISKNKLTEKVIFKGYVKEVYKEILKFDMHVLTSRFEGMGYVNLEAMALGVPIITTDVGGISNFLMDKHNALITKVDDPDSTMKAIERLINDDRMRVNIINNARNTVSEYSIERMANETANFYMNNIQN